MYELLIKTQGKTVEIQEPIVARMRKGITFAYHVEVKDGYDKWIHVCKSSDAGNMKILVEIINDSIKNRVTRITFQ